MAASPAFATDGDAFCVGRTSEEQFGFVATSDKGVTWERTRATGLTDAAPNLGQLIVSPLYTEDHSVFLTTRRGLWRTTDGGATFSLLTSITDTSSRSLSPFVTSNGISLDRHLALAYAAGPISGKIDPPVFAPVVGTPETEMHFAIPPTFLEDGRAFAFSRLIDLIRPGFRILMYACDVELVCARKLFEFPWGQELSRVWFAPDYESTRTIVVETYDNDGIPTLWRSDETSVLSQWDSVNTLVEVIKEAGGSEARTYLAGNPMFPNALFLRLSYDPFASEIAPSSPPAEQLFKSNDGGLTWNRVAYGRYSLQPGRRGGGLPWTKAVAVANRSYISLEADGRLLALGSLVDSDGIHERPYCSVDGGRTWASDCPLRP